MLEKTSILARTCRADVQEETSRFASLVASPLISGNDIHVTIRKTQEGSGGLRGENPGAFPKEGPIFQQPFALPQNTQTMAGIAFRAARKSFQQRGNLPDNFSRNFGQPQPFRVF